MKNWFFEMINKVDKPEEIITSVRIDSDFLQM